VLGAIAGLTLESFAPRRYTPGNERDTSGNVHVDGILAAIAGSNELVLAAAGSLAGTRIKVPTEK
jgi:hypothetical protein